MSFDNPLILGLLLLPVLSVPAAIIHYRKNRNGTALFTASAPSGERQFLSRELKLRLVISDVFFLLFLCFMIVALAGPRWGIRLVADYRRGVDLVLAFDLSRSMNVQDCPPYRNQSGSQDISRLERGIGIARDLANTLGDVRLGTAAGKGRGVLAVPLTYDSETVMAFLYGLDSRSITGTGTNLESLLNAASSAFRDSAPNRRGIILFSDGESLSGSFQAAVEKARKAGISISAVGLGSDQGGPVPIERGQDNPGGVLLSPDGTPVISTRQSDSLRNGAEKTGGIYIDGSRNDAAMLLVNYVNSLSSESRLSGHRREANPRWQIFILAGIAFLGGARIIGFSRRQSVGPRSHSSGSRFSRETVNGLKNGLYLSCLLCVFLFTSCYKTQGKLIIMEGNFFNSRGFYLEAISSYLKALEYEEAAPYAEYGLGSAYFSLEEGAAALERYKAAEQILLGLRQEGHQELKYRIFYNTGIIFFEQGKYDEAANAFRNALKADGSRIEAKRNLELSLLTVERNSSPQPASSERKAENGGTGESGSGSVLFEYLRQREQEQWKSREWTTEGESSGPDY